MFSTPEQLSEATKNSVEAHLEWLASLFHKSFENVEKLVDLNVNLTKTTLEESASAAKQLLTAKDPQEFLALSAARAQPQAEKALAYGRQVAGIASSVQAEISKAADTQIAQTSHKITSLIDDFSKNAPVGSESAVAFLKSVVGNANAGYEQLSKSTKQAMEALDVNLNTAVNQFTNSATKTATRASAPSKK